MLVQAILVGIWAGICGIDLFDGLLHIHRPLVSGLVVGLILGDLTTGLFVGGTLELIFLGAIPVGGAQPPNVVLGGIVGISTAILSNLDATAAVAVAMPVAILMQSLITLLFTLYSPVMHYAEDQIDKGNFKVIAEINYWQMAILFVAYFILAFLPVYYGSEVAYALNAIPERILHGFTIAGGLLPAVGFAILMQIMYQTRYLAYLVIGFVLTTFMGLPILPVSFVAVSIALIEYYVVKECRQAPANANSDSSDDNMGI